MTSKMIIPKAVPLNVWAKWYPVEMSKLFDDVRDILDIIVPSPNMPSEMDTSEFMYNYLVSTQNTRLVLELFSGVEEIDILTINRMRKMIYYKALSILNSFLYLKQSVTWLKNVTPEQLGNYRKEISGGWSDDNFLSTSGSSDTETNSKKSINNKLSTFDSTNVDLSNEEHVGNKNDNTSNTQSSSTSSGHITRTYGDYVETGFRNMSKLDIVEKFRDIAQFDIIDEWLNQITAVFMYSNYAV